MNDARNKTEVFGIGFALYFVYAACIWLCDAFDLFCFLTGLPQVTLVSRALVILLLVIALILLKNRIHIRKAARPDLFWLIGCAIILGFCFYKGIIPDVSTDVKKYHIFVQNPGFQSMTKEPFFFSGGFQFYGFRWADRLFYPFRWLLGYRMGTLFGGLVNALLFTQIRSLLILLYGDTFSIIRERCRKTFKQPILPGILLNESIFALLITMTYDVFMQSGSYMVDFIAIPFMLEALHILLIKKEQKHAAEMVWYAALCGCFFAAKMTNVVYVAPMVAAYLLKFRKHLSFKRFIAAFAAALVPVSIYLIYAYAETGNPVFPYFNTIFKSPFFSLYDFKDTRWGPANLKDTLLWPFLSVFDPYYRTSEIPNEYSLGLIGLVVVWFLQTISFVFRKKDRKYGLLLFVSFASAYLWAATTGYLRYFILGHMLIGIVYVGFTANSLYRKNWLRSCIAIFVFVSLMIQPFKYMPSIAGGREWSWRNNLNEDQFQQNIQWIFKDRGEIDDESSYSTPVNTILLKAAENGGIANLLYPEAKNICQSYLDSNVSDPDITAYWNEKINHYLDDGGVYDLVIPKCDGLQWENYFSSLEHQGLKVTKIIWPKTYFVREQAVALIGLKRLNTGEQNLLYKANEENNWLSVPNQNFWFSANVTLNQTRGRYDDENTAFCLIARDAQKSAQIYLTPIREQTTLFIDEEFDLSGFSSDVRLEMYWLDENGDLIDTRMYDCFVINPQIK